MSIKLSICSFIVTTSGIILTSSDTLAASYDCSRARGCVENVICESPQLSDMDSEMSDLYYKIKSNLSRKRAKTLTVSQKNWLASRNSCNCDANCLVGSYKNRIESLQRMSESMGE